MARPGPARQAKRQRELAKKEKRKAKEERRALRKAQKAEQSPDSDDPEVAPDIAGIVPGPQEPII
jgi:hypothetical protein